MTKTKTKTKTKVKGFVVCSQVNGPLALFPEAGITSMVKNGLWHGTFTTLFPTLQKARNAIRRTERYAARVGYTKFEAWRDFYVKEVRA